MPGPVGHLPHVVREMVGDDLFLVGITEDDSPPYATV